MPIQPENRDRYPANWSTEVVPRIAARSGGRCECTGECGWRRCPTRIHGAERCTALNGQTHPVTGSRVVLTTAHLNHTPEDVRDEVLRHWCQGCHLAYDNHIHQANRRRNKLARRGVMPLWGDL